MCKVGWSQSKFQIWREPPIGISENTRPACPSSYSVTLVAETFSKLTFLSISGWQNIQIMFSLEKKRDFILLLSINFFIYWWNSWKKSLHLSATFPYKMVSYHILDFVRNSKTDFSYYLSQHLFICDKWLLRRISTALAFNEKQKSLAKLSQMFSTFGICPHISSQIHFGSNLQTVCQKGV